MSLSPTKIDWADVTWNPMTGCFGHPKYRRDGDKRCWFCYAPDIIRRFPKAFPNGFIPTFHTDRLGLPARTKKPKKVFVGSMTDLFGPWVPDSVINSVFAACRRAPQHTYMFLTKFPERYENIISLQTRDLNPLPANWWFGHTVTSGHVSNKATWENEVNDFVSLEPLLGRVIINKIFTPKWVIVGALSGPVKMPPARGWLWDIRNQCDELGIPLFEKGSLKKLLPNLDQRWPVAMFYQNEESATEGTENTEKRNYECIIWNDKGPGSMVFVGYLGAALSVSRFGWWQIYEKGMLLVSGKEDNQENGKYAAVACIEKIRSEAGRMKKNKTSVNSVPSVAEKRGC